MEGRENRNSRGADLTARTKRKDRGEKVDDEGLNKGSRRVKETFVECVPLGRRTLVAVISGRTLCPRFSGFKGMPTQGYVDPSPSPGVEYVSVDGRPIC